MAWRSYHCRGVESPPPDCSYRLAPAWDHQQGRDFCAGIAGFVRDLPGSAVIYRGRNTLVRCAALGREVVIKQFRTPSAFKALLYRLRAGKARRSFEVGRRLGELGVATPEPLAAVEYRQGGRLVESYYCCAWVASLGTVRDLHDPAHPDRRQRIEELGAFVGRLHKLRVFHRDLTSGNILMVADREKPGVVAHSLVDLNRLEFRRVGWLGGLANLMGPGFRGDDVTTLIAGYCRARGSAIGPGFSALVYRLLRLPYDAMWAVKNRTRPLRRRIGL